MKKNTISLLLAASALVFMAGCAGGAKNSAAQHTTAVAAAKINPYVRTRLALCSFPSPKYWLMSG